MAFNLVGNGTKRITLKGIIQPFLIKTSIKIAVFWNVMPYSLVGIYKTVEKFAVSIFSINNFLLDYMTSQCRRLRTSHLVKFSPSKKHSEISAPVCRCYQCHLYHTAQFTVIHSGTLYPLRETSN